MNKAETLVFSTPSDVELAIARTFNAPRELVFDAWTKPQYVTQWLLGPDGWSMPVCEIDLRPGGAWRFVWRNTDGQEMEMTGVYREVRPPERIVHTERWGAEWPETINTIVFTEHKGTTTVTLTTLYASKAARDAALKTGMVDGISISYDRLAALLSGLIST